MRYSIYTINYNNKEGLRKTIESDIHQTSCDFESIINDGGSSDDSVQSVVKRLLNKYFVITNHGGYKVYKRSFLMVNKDIKHCL